MYNKTLITVNNWLIIKHAYVRFGTVRFLSVLMSYTDIVSHQIAMLYMWLGYITNFHTSKNYTCKHFQISSSPITSSACAFFF